MRNMVLAGLALAAASALSPVQAAPAPLWSVTAGSGVILVEGGCGPEAYRAANGYCYPRRPPPPPYYRRECPPGYHLTPYGCRPNW